MTLKSRIKIMGVGMLIAAYGCVLLRGHLWIYKNHYSLAIYSPAVIATGVFVAALALLPAGPRMGRLFTSIKSGNVASIRRRRK